MSRRSRTGRSGGGRLWCALALLLAAGCTVGPDFKPPTLPSGAQAPLIAGSGPTESEPRDSAPAAVSDAPPPDDWWTLYQDATLDALVQEALAANTDLRVAAGNLAAARATLRAADDARVPQTGLDAGAVYGRDPATDEILEIGGHEPENLWLYHALVEVSYEIDLWGHVSRAIEAARADEAAARAARDTARISVAAGTVSAYAQACALAEQIGVARQSLDLASRQLRITRDRRDAGAAADFDVVRAEQLAAVARAALPPLEGQRRIALLQLAALLGRTPDRAPTLACQGPPQLAAPLPVGDGVALIRRRPDVRRAEARLHAATARIGVATAGLYPRISLLGDLGGAYTELHGLFGNEGLAWGAGPGIHWEFPNQSGVRARIAQARAGGEVALASFDGTVLTALKETQSALAAYDAQLQRRAALQLARDRADQAFGMAREQVLAGSSSDLALLVAQQTALTADAAASAASGILVQDQVALFKALGGGWRQ